MARPILSFTVEGAPVAQGSKVRAGQGLRESNDRKLRPWRQAVSAAAIEAVAEADPKSELPLLLGPVALHLTFVLARPKAHYGSGRNARTVKPSAPWYVASRPDLDKLLRAVGDALTGVAWRDDGQLAHVRMSKVYGPRAHLVVELFGLPHAEAGQ